jgi:alpha-beta hydrolase superfamily lysophospholipase
MTNSYNLSRNNKVVFFHGLNNNQDCFGPLIRHFKELGFETELVILPGHGKNRKEAKDIKEAIGIFDQKMRNLKDQSYYAIAFSHGALYLQLWLEKNQEHKPAKQILLAPALYINRQKLIERALKILPSFFAIKSMSPKPFRRYEIMNAWEYNILIQGMLIYQKVRGKFRIPTKIFVDPKDELVDAYALSSKLENVEFIERKYLRKGLGCHHIIFHPDYFEEAHWREFTRKLESFLVND